MKTAATAMCRATILLQSGTIVGLMLGQEMQRKGFFSDYYSGTDFPFAESGMRELTTAGT